MKPAAFAHSAASAVATALLNVTAAEACTICATATGEQVRSGIFNDAFAVTAAQVLAPFPLLFALVVLLHNVPLRGKNS